MTETLTAGAKIALGKLVNLVKQRFAGDDAAQHALAEAEKSPDNAEFHSVATAISAAGWIQAGQQ